MEGLLEWAAVFIIQLIESSGYIGIFVLMALEGSFIPLPSEIVMPFSGYLVSQGVFSIWLVALAGASGNIVGTLVSYGLARYLGLPFLRKYGKYFLMSGDDIEKASLMFNKHGASIIFFTRLMPGIRGFIAIPAGVARMNLIQFIVYVFIGSYLWSLFLAYIGYVAGENWESVSGYISKFGTLFVILGAVIFVWWLYNQLKKVRKTT